LHSTLYDFAILQNPAYSILKPHIEAIIFTAIQPVSVAEISVVINDFLHIETTEDIIKNCIDTLLQTYNNDQTCAFAPVATGGGYQFLSKSTHHDLINYVLQQNSKRKLPKSALESLAIIAYKQPITKPEIEQIRGVSCDYAIQKLLERNLITITGKSDAPGRPILYGTSDFFMDYFGINTLNDLPKISDIYTKQNEIGENS
jgi:segregation and condensation protein B